MATKARRPHALLGQRAAACGVMLAGFHTPGQGVALKQHVQARASLPSASSTGGKGLAKRGTPAPTGMYWGNELPPKSRRKKAQSRKRRLRPSQKLRPERKKWESAMFFGRRESAARATAAPMLTCPARKPQRAAAEAKTAMLQASAGASTAPSSSTRSRECSEAGGDSLVVAYGPGVSHSCVVAAASELDNGQVLLMFLLRRGGGGGFWVYFFGNF